MFNWRKPATPAPALAPAPAGIQTSHPNGHFYSPVVDPEELGARIAEIWPEYPAPLAGIDFDEQSHREILDQWFPEFISGYDYPELESETSSEYGFYTQNSQFSWLDSRTLFVFLRKLRARQFIEVGSGFSSLLAADVNLRFLGGECQVSCIEPYPRAFLKKGVPGITALIEKKAQQLDLEYFSRLNGGDILFIDSSHVSKTGSDVNYLVFEVLPRLKPGVLIHIHDIFLPHEYPKEWVLAENRSWNEQYLVRALLMYSSTFKVVFGCSYAFHKYPQAVISALNLESKAGFGGGSLWIRKN